MNIWAIVPIKPLRRGKSRLAGVLSEEERTQLNRSFLENTLRVLKSVPEISQTLVISRDPTALTVAREFGARTVLEDGVQDLNIALTRATLIAQAYSAHSILILPADIPLLTADEVRTFLLQAEETPSLVIAPDRRDDGTNAMLISPPSLMKYQYGSNSFEQHYNHALNATTKVKIFRSDILGLDLDLPEDLKYYQELKDVEAKDIFEFPVSF